MAHIYMNAVISNLVRKFFLWQDERYSSQVGWQLIKSCDVRSQWALFSWFIFGDLIFWHRSIPQNFSYWSLGISYKSVASLSRYLSKCDVEAHFEIDISLRFSIKNLGCSNHGIFSFFAYRFLKVCSSEKRNLIGRVAELFFFFFANLLFVEGSFYKVCRHTAGLTGNIRLPMNSNLLFSLL